MFGRQRSEADASSDMMKYETQRWIYKYTHPICISPAVVIDILAQALCHKRRGIFFVVYSLLEGRFMLLHVKVKLCWLYFPSEKFALFFILPTSWDAARMTDMQICYLINND